MFTVPSGHTSESTSGTDNMFACKRSAFILSSQVHMAERQKLESQYNIEVWC